MNTRWIADCHMISVSVGSDCCNVKKLSVVINVNNGPIIGNFARFLSGSETSWSGLQTRQPISALIGFGDKWVTSLRIFCQIQIGQNYINGPVRASQSPWAFLFCQFISNTLYGLCLSRARHLSQIPFINLRHKIYIHIYIYINWSKLFHLPKFQ